ncbi:hypothetical protein HanHA300_Chr03g0094161 [Helianthus annuus]|nr:hypothetical protein HanHA300_Chr03g0094161 [Helianthus annuus]KAJ0608194.1 hypothetical protein HanHA89_Chr03g0105881 [Helianthus annuus]KAJ0768258.1 hypothetical protein HanLR1_Chr03g0099241 [Helianthus annuus]
MPYYQPGAGRDLLSLAWQPGWFFMTLYIVMRCYCRKSICYFASWICEWVVGTVAIRTISLSLQELIIYRCISIDDIRAQTRQSPNEIWWRLG